MHLFVSSAFLTCCYLTHAFHGDSAPMAGTSHRKDVISRHGDSSLLALKAAMDPHQYALRMDSLKGKRFVSIAECLDLFQYQLKERKGSDQNKLVFIDGSWWHKGNLNGRKMYVQ